MLMFIKVGEMGTFITCLVNTQIEIEPVSEFNEFEPWLKSAKNRFQLSAGLNFKKLNKFKLNSSRGSNSLNSASKVTIMIKYN